MNTRKEESIKTCLDQRGRGRRIICLAHYSKCEDSRTNERINRYEEEHVYTNVFRLTKEKRKKEKQKKNQLVMYIIALVIIGRRKKNKSKRRRRAFKSKLLVYKVQEFMAFLFEARNRRRANDKTGIDDDNAFIFKYPNSFVVYFKAFH